MASLTRIAIDCMGGDFGLRVSLPAARQALQLFPDLRLLLVGDTEQIKPMLADVDLNRIELLHTTEVVSMSERPAQALRRKRNSSMRLAIDQLREGRVDAVVSAGNTGALMAMGCLVLDTLPGIDRPAICTALPTEKGHCYLLDLGANVDTSAENLHQFAMMASALAQARDHNPAPKVALLNVGDEESKGNEQVKLAAELIDGDSNLNFVGYVEGDDLFRGDTDIVVCDGFVGNVALKVCEGTAMRIADIVRAQFRSNLLTRLVGLMAMPVLRRVYRILNPQQYNGASLLGLRGVVVKCHGNSSIESFVYAIATARDEVRGDLLSLISRSLAALQNE